MKFLAACLRVLAVLLVAVLLFAAAIVARGAYLAHRRVPGTARALAVPPDSSLVARGEHLVRSSCAGCHSSHMQPPLTGSEEDFFHQPGVPDFGHLFAPNLTPAGRIAQWSDAEIARAIREGVDREGRPLLVMPSQRFHGLSDGDVASIIAWLRAQPAVETPVRPRAFNLLAYAILGANVFPTSATAPLAAPVSAPAEGPTAEYGEYLVGALTCQDCHGEDLRGGVKGQFPPLGPNLVELAASHSVEQFAGAVREGRSAIDGRSLDPTRMPYPVYSHLSDVEVQALHALLKAGGPRRKS